MRLVVLLALPSAVALLLFAEPLVAVLYHYGAFRDADVAQTVRALMGYGVGLMGLVSIKILAPGFYAAQDIRTPVRIGIAVLVLTQILNAVLFVLMGMFVMMAVMRTIGAALWLKSFFDCVHNQVHRTKHVGQHRVWFYF